jgi:hypothetical protein
VSEWLILAGQVLCLAGGGFGTGLYLGKSIRRDREAMHRILYGEKIAEPRQDWAKIYARMDVKR